VVRDHEIFVHAARNMTRMGYLDSSNSTCIPKYLSKKKSDF
jgi:hypothetical protein